MARPEAKDENAYRWAGHGASSLGRLFIMNTARLIASLLVVIAVGGCSQKLAHRAQEFIASGDHYALARDLAAADIQYRNAIKLMPSSIDAHLRRLELARRRHDREVLAQEVFTLADLAPDDAALNTRAGDLYAQMGRLAQAEQAFKRAVMADPDGEAAHRGLARLYMTQQQPAKAEPEWHAVAHSRDGDPFALADFHVAQRRFDEAEAELRRQLETFVGSDAARLRLARVLHEEGHGAEADQLLDRLIQHDGRNATPWIVRGQLRLAGHHPDAAARAFAAALHADPTSIEALTALTAMDLNAKRTATAIARVERALAASPDAVPVLLLAGRMYESVRQPDMAEARLMRAIQVAPSELDAYALLGAVYVRAGRLEAARTQFARLAERQPDNLSATTMIGMLFEAEGREADAQATYEQLLSKYPHAGVAANNLACIYARHRRLDDALHYALIARDDLRHTPQASDTLGWIYYQRQQPHEALPLLNEAAERQPDNSVYHFHLGMAYADTGAVTQARVELSEALANAGEFEGRDQAVRRKAELDRAAGRR